MQLLTHSHESSLLVHIRISYQSPPTFPSLNLISSLLSLLFFTPSHQVPALGGGLILTLTLSSSSSLVIVVSFPLFLEGSSPRYINRKSKKQS